MARDEAALSTCMIVSDYVPAHYKWTEDELAALGNCQATAEIIKKRLEDNGAKVKEMYAIEHKGENKVAKEYHSDINETKVHYHILVRFEPSHGATLKEIANFIGVPMEFIEKPKRGRYSFDNMLSYLIHIKYEKKLQYAPADVVTIAGTDYIDYYNERKDSWIKARDKVAENGGKTCKQLYLQAEKKLVRGELTYGELANIKEYCKLLTDRQYQKALETKFNLVKKLCSVHFQNMKKMINDKKITSWEEIEASEHFGLLQKYNYEELLKKALKDAMLGDFSKLSQGISERKINMFFDEIAACDEYKTICQLFKEEIEKVIRARATKEYLEMYYSSVNRNDPRNDPKVKEKYKFAYLYYKNEIEMERMPYIY